MGAFIVIQRQPFVQVFLQFLQCAVQLFAEHDLIELIQNGLVETLADTVCLRMSGFGFCVVYVIDGQIQLVIVLFNFAAVFGASVSENTQHRQRLSFEKRQYSVVQQVGSGDWGFGGVELGKGDLWWPTAASSSTNPAYQQRHAAAG